MSCDHLKEIIKATPGNTTAKLIAVLEALGVTSTAELAEIIGVSARGVRMARVSKERQRKEGNGVVCSDHLRRRVRKAFDCTCQYCGSKETAAEIFGVDRILPGKHGGLYRASNVTLSCSACNSKKGSGAPPVPVRSLLQVEGAI